ncbi:MAG: hypothetical protein PVH30_10100 [Desulfobacterales bacterium]|jgi:hypothetical protein
MNSATSAARAIDNLKALSDLFAHRLDGLGLDEFLCFLLWNKVLIEVHRDHFHALRGVKDFFLAPESIPMHW